MPRTAVGFGDFLVERVEGAPGLLSSGYAARDDEGSCAAGELRPNFEGRGLAVALEVGFEVDDLSREPVRALIARHLEGMFAASPPESVHAFDVDKLRAPGVTFFSAWVGAELAGCGALKPA